MHTYGIAQSDRALLIHGMQLLRAQKINSMADAVEGARIDTLRSLMADHDACDMLIRVIEKALSFNVAT